ncbi:MAG: Na+/H+ antiporter NhaC family protein [Bacteroidales bacterium]|nr:Na+/H+ antiporter NhaC family protein [Bacteroidales bacterium]
MNGNISHKKGILALLPLAVFLGVYLISSAIIGDFYKIPVSAAFLLASVFAVAITPGKLSYKINIFSDGAGNRNVLLMIWIFILAGAFAGTAKDIGAVEATVNAALHIIPGKLLFAGIFLTSCVISLSIGTSVGTIVALMPIAGGIAQDAGLSLPFMAAVVVGGAFFGDNLSFISDTTIAATNAMGCKMADKFKANIKIVIPAMLTVTAIYIALGWNINAIPSVGKVEFFKMLPYLAVIVLALAGVNVTAVLASGIVLNAIIGWCTGSFGWAGWLGSIGNGVAGMGELIIVTMLAGGMLATIRHNGGLDYIINSISGKAKGRLGGELSIAALVSLANLCTANNTIAILTTSGIAKEICDRFGIDPRRGASLLDTFSCFIQGIIPYGAQILMASSLAGIAPTAIIRHLYYPFALGLFALGAILIGNRKKSTWKK